MFILKIDKIQEFWKGLILASVLRIFILYTQPENSSQKIIL